MKPDADRLLEVSAITLMTRLGPGLSTGYEQSSAGALGALLLALREEYDRAAARRVEENEAIRGLCREALPVVTDDALGARLREAGAGATRAYEVSALESENAALRGLLIDLHAHAEGLEGEPARALVESIWAELARSTERRRLGMAVF